MFRVFMGGRVLVPYRGSDGGGAWQWS